MCYNVATLHYVSHIISWIISSNDYIATKLPLNPGGPASPCIPGSPVGPVRPDNKFTVTLC